VLLPLKDDNPTRSFPAVTILLIVLNVGVFLAQELYGPAFNRAFAMVPGLVSHAPLAALRSPLPEWATILTSMFMHGSWLHLGGNMLFLWIFGNNTEDTLGHVGFLFFYLVCGVAAAALHILLGWNSEVPTVGASGAIAGVLGAYIYLFPQARITTLVVFLFFTVVELPAQAVLGVWFILQVINMFGMAAATLGGHQDGGGVAFGAHVGGFLAGLILIRLVASRRKDRYRSARRPRYFDEHWG
jgi:membrane associated rhomboid family serine protease